MYRTKDTGEAYFHNYNNNGGRAELLPLADAVPPGGGGGGGRTHLFPDK
jgi:hypothetical protein